MRGARTDSGRRTKDRLGTPRPRERYAGEIGVFSLGLVYQTQSRRSQPPAHRQGRQENPKESVLSQAKGPRRPSGEAGRSSPPRCSREVLLETTCRTVMRLPLPSSHSVSVEASRGTREPTPPPVLKRPPTSVTGTRTSAPTWQQRGRTPFPCRRGGHRNPNKMEGLSKTQGLVT